MTRDDASETGSTMLAGPARGDRSRWAGYLLALSGCAVAVLIRLMLEPALGNASQFIIFYLAVAPAAIIGGLRPGLLATVLASLCGIILSGAVSGAPTSPHSTFIIRLALFVLSGVMISLIAQRSIAGWQLARRHLAEIRTIYHTAPVGMCLLDSRLRYRAINGALAALNGHSAAEHLGRSIHELLPAEIVAQIEPPIRQVLDSGQAVLNQEVQGPRPEGEERHRCYLASYSPVYGEDRRLLGISIIVQDLTRQRHEQQKLRESERRLRAIFDNAGVGIVEVTGDDRFIAANERACQILGYSLPQLRQLSVRELTWPEDRDTSDRLNAEVHQGQRDRVSYEKRYRHASGAPVWVQVTVSAVRDDAGHWLRSITTIEDITQRNEAEDSLRRRTRSLQLLSDGATRLLTEDRPEQAIRQTFDQLADHLGLEMYFNYLLTEDGRRLRLNACAGVDDTTCRKLEYLDLGDPVCGEVAQRGEGIVIEGIQHDTDPRTAVLRGLGVQVYACHPLLAHGKVIGTLSFGSRQREDFAPEELKLLQTISNQVAMALERARLVDELHRRAQELAAATTSAQCARQAAEEASAAKDHFLAVLSHELRTPLTPVVATAGLLQQDPAFPAQYHDDIATIRRNVELEARLIDDLLDVTRITRGKLELNRQVVPLCEVLRRAVEVCEPDLGARGLHFALDIGDAAPYYLNVDPARLQQVFWNLLKNAIKFTPPGGAIAVRCRREADRVLVEVNDSGKGIEPQLLPHIFRPFEQGGIHITRQFGGLGLGLTITKGLVELHGGTIEARSGGPGQGASFLLSLPLAAQTPEAVHAALMPGTACAQNRHGLRILMVEDHGDTARIMQRVLTADGHEVQTAGDVASALAALEHDQFDLLLSDLGLPDGNGTEIVRALRHREERARHGEGAESGKSGGRGERGEQRCAGAEACEHRGAIPAIALSGYGREEDIRRSREAAFDEHLIKPVDIGRLKQTIRRLGQTAH